MDAAETKGLIFDINEFGVFDGFGIRTTVFLKGCPLRCSWCHNPEGMNPEKQLMASRQGCLRCGKCLRVCEKGDGLCTLCGRCVRVCPLHLRRICGFEITAGALAEKLMRSRTFFEKNEGGVTFSGGEPLAQPNFLTAVLDRMDGIHKAIETSGFSRPEIFESVIRRLDLVIMDIKAVDSEIHVRYTGVDNKIILDNLKLLKESGKPFIIRIPLIPGVNDTTENLRETAGLLSGSANLIRVELLPYHRTAGAKYEMVGEVYRPGFDTSKQPMPDTGVFEDKGISCILF